MLKTTQRLTASLVERLPAPTKSGKQQIVWDDDLKGFGVLLSGTTNAKSYVVRIRIKGQAKRPRLTIGRTSWYKDGKEQGLAFEDAKQKARKCLVMGRDGTDPAVEEKQRLLKGRTLRQALDEHVSQVRKAAEIKGASIDQLNTAIENHLGDWLDLPLTDITRAMVEKRHAEIPTRLRSKHKATNGKTQANHVMRSLRRLYNVASVDDEGLRNPVDVLRLKKSWFPEPKRDDHVPPHLMEAFWSALDALDRTGQSQTADVIRFMVLTGLREGNALGLRWEQVDFKARAIRFAPEIMKSKRVHELPMSDYLQRLLETRRADGQDANGWVWPSNAKSGHVEEIRKTLNACATKAKIKKLRIHGLRRTFATLARRVIAKDDVTLLLNHASQHITDQYIISYVDILRTPMQKATDEILRLAGVNITDPEKLPKDSAALQAAYVRRFGDVTFTTFDMEPAKRDTFLREGLLRMKPIADSELIERGEMADYRGGLMSPLTELQTRRTREAA